MVAIENLQVGDLVLSRDEFTSDGELVYAPIVDVFSRMTNEMTVVRLRSEQGVTSLRLTPEHPAYVEGKGWIEARLLAAGDAILDYDGNVPLTVISVAFEKTTERVYNFEVSGTHTYFAGDVGAWVHNAKGGKNSSAGGVNSEQLREARQRINDFKKNNKGKCSAQDIDNIVDGMNLAKGPRKSLLKTLKRANSKKRNSRGF